MRSTLAALLLLPALALGQPLRPEEQVDAPAAEEVVRTIEIARGTQQLVDVAGVERVSIGDDAVADARVIEGDQLLLTALKRGSTSLIVWLPTHREAYRVVVTDSRVVEEARSVLEAAGLSPQLSLIETSTGKLVLRGELHTLAELERYRSAARMLPGEVVDLVRADTAIYRELAARITEALHAADLPGAEAVAVHGTIFLEGSVPDEDERERAMKIARAIHGDIVTRLE
ncbi:MAG: pilus assembly protein N-terminal domain-containing protein [Deltaproteobacteria bacterium]|nr:pilus assembly protein N-terminal domain-containing protein [Deltaproteobacteria bacterium]